ncbi:hypothetical protein GCM10027059_02360 [Myceligenerans halotolerans]
MTDYPDDGPYAEPKGEVLTVTNMIALAGAVLITGVLLDRFAELDPAYAISRIVSMPFLVAAIVVAARRRAWPALILPAVALALVATTFFLGN